MDSDYDIQGMSSINVDSELQDDKEEQLAALNLHMDHHHQHQYLLAVPDLYSFDPPDAWTVESSFGGDNSNSSDTFSPIFSTAAEQFQPHQVSVERPINLCTAPNNNLASQSDCDEALSRTPTSSSTPRGSRTDQLRTNDDGTLPGASAGISNMGISPAVPALSTYNLQVGDDDHHSNNDNDNNSDDNASNHPMDTMREMIFRVAAMQPVNIDPESIKRPKRRNVRISKDPQSVAARHRRERISERIRILQRLVPGGTRMDTASMLDEAIHYVKFLKMQVQELESAGRVGGFKGNFCNSGANISYLHPLFPNFCFIADSRAYYPNNYSLS